MNPKRALNVKIMFVSPCFAVLSKAGIPFFKGKALLSLSHVVNTFSQMETIIERGSCYFRTK